MAGTEERPRFWGFWTRGKLDLLRRYLNAFTTASQKADERIYLDLFGGQPENRDRLTNEVLDGSARIALATTNPPFTRLRFFELDPHAQKLRDVLLSSYPGRDVQVIAGDCNATIRSVLAQLSSVRWAPTFAFVDPNGPDVRWSTLQALAEFKKPGLSKTEIWLLLAAGMFTRNLRLDGSVRDRDADKLTAMYGVDHWKHIYTGRVDGRLGPREAREEYVNLMRWRLEHVLGYKTTHPLEIFNEQERSIYHMIFATDHSAGDRIMTDLYNKAASEFPAMRRAARLRRTRLEDEAAGVLPLFTDDVDLAAKPVGASERLYRHTKPWQPYDDDGGRLEVPGEGTTGT